MSKKHKKKDKKSDADVSGQKPEKMSRKASPQCISEAPLFPRTQPHRTSARDIFQQPVSHVGLLPLRSLLTVGSQRDKAAVEAAGAMPGPGGVDRPVQLAGAHVQRDNPG